MCRVAVKRANQKYLDKNNFLDILFWNIGGQFSKLIGDKFNDPDFLDEIGSPHLIGIAELHIHEIPFISGYSLIKQKIRKKNHKGPKISGGLAVFARNDVISLFKYIPNDHEDSIWVKVKKEALGNKKDLYIGTAYISPSKGKQKEDESLDIFFDEINKFKRTSLVLAQGDLNARTGIGLDYLEEDKFDDKLGITNEHKPPPRNSHDLGKMNTRGKNLLSNCKANDMLIVNGRKVGDIFGSPTSFQWNGEGLVDYTLADTLTFELIH